MKCAIVVVTLQRLLLEGRLWLLCLWLNRLNKIMNTFLDHRTDADSVGLDTITFFHRRATMNNYPWKTHILLIEKFTVRIILRFYFSAPVIISSEKLPPASLYTIFVPSM